MTYPNPRAAATLPWWGNLHMTVIRRTFGASRAADCPKDAPAKAN